MMKNRLFILIFLVFDLSHPTMAQSQEDAIFFTQSDSGMGHVEVVGGHGDFSTPTGVISGFATPSSGMMFGQLFPPSHIMRQQEKLKLTEKQINSIKTEMRAFQSGIVDIQWDLNSNQGQLNKELAKDSIDLEKSMSLMDRVLEAESKLKKSHMGLLIKIRNVLNDEQIKTLRSNPQFPFGPMGNFSMPMGMSDGSIDTVMLMN